MHRFQSQATINRFRVAALLICLKWLAVPAAAVWLVYGLAMNDHRLIYIALGIIGGIVVLTLTEWIVAARTRCPLCMTPVLGSKRCAKHRHARTVLGSYRLRVALAVIFRGTFRCPYCHEPSMLKIRERRTSKCRD